MEDGLIKQKLREALSSSQYTSTQKESLLRQYQQRFDSDFGNKDFDIYAMLGWRDFLEVTEKGLTPPVSAPLPDSDYLPSLSL